MASLPQLLQATDELLAQKAGSLLTTPAEVDELAAQLQQVCQAQGLVATHAECLQAAERTLTPLPVEPVTSAPEATLPPIDRRGLVGGIQLGVASLLGALGHTAWQEPVLPRPAWTPGPQTLGQAAERMSAGLSHTAHGMSMALMVMAAILGLVGVCTTLRWAFSRFR